MFENKLALTAFATLSVLSYAHPLAAMTLVADSQRDFRLEQGYNGWYYGYDDGSGFQQDLQPAGGEFNASGGSFNGQSSQAMVRRWTSDFDGDVKLGINFSGTANSDAGVEFFQKVRLNGETILSENSAIRLTDSSYNMGLYAVKKGDSLDFLFDATDEQWLGRFNWEIKIETDRKAQNPTPVLPPPNPNRNDPSIQGLLPSGAGLVFLKTQDGHLIDLGLLVDDIVYYADPIVGVNEQPLHQFKKDFNDELKVIPNNLARKMAEKIETRLGTPYLRSNIADPNPYEQKGYYGQFTNVGLIEWAAEEVGIFGGQGFIPQFQESNEKFKSFLSLESVYQQTLLTGYESIEFGFISANYLDFFKSESYDRFKVLSGSITWLNGILEAVDFIVTDPLGRQMGYVSNFGFFNEIPDVALSFQDLNFLPDTNLSVGLKTAKTSSGELLTTSGKVAPKSLKDPAYCLNNSPANTSSNTQSDGVFRFLLDRRLPGEYKIEKRDPNDCHTTVPEPGAIAGLIATAGFALKFLKQHTR